MSQTTMGPKGGHRPNTAIAGGAIVYGTAIKRGADLNTLVQATNASVNQGIATDDQPTAGRAFAFVDQPGEIVEGRAGAAFALDALLDERRERQADHRHDRSEPRHRARAAGGHRGRPARAGALAQRGILAP
jgi:hypothetical protein